MSKLVVYVQLRFRDGSLQDTSHFNKAWETFIENFECEKISWNTPNGKRLRLTKETGRHLADGYVDYVELDSPKHQLLQAGYVEDIIIHEIELEKEKKSLDRS
jgi:hypothetical protein